MTEKDKLIIEQYRTAMPAFGKLEEIVVSILENIASHCGIRVYNINHRIKGEESLIGKLERKGDKYTSLDDITDILGTRVICFFSDEVDTLAKQIEHHFDVDWDESIDKRKYLEVNTFGYLSVHYICSLKKEGDYPKELKTKRFEVQMCSMMQHIWATMEHDLGYKTKYGVPTAVRRDFFRLAGLLEIADEHFVRIRDSVAQYTREVHDKIINDNANSVLIDSVSLEEYMTNSKNMTSFLQTLGNICEADIAYQSPENYLEQLEWLKKKTLGDLQEMMEKNSSLALRMIQKTLACADLDILSSTVALRFLCHAELINSHYTTKQMVEFLQISMKDKERAERYAKRLQKFGTTDAMKSTSSID